MSALSSPRGVLVSISLDSRVLSEACEPQAADEPLVLALDGLAVDEEPEPLLEGERSNIGFASHPETMSGIEGTTDTISVR